MFHDFCQSVTLVFCQRTHVSHDHHPRGQCCSSARISYDAPCMGAISYQKIFASALNMLPKPPSAPKKRRMLGSFVSAKEPIVLDDTPNSSAWISPNATHLIMSSH